MECDSVTWKNSPLPNQQQKLTYSILPRTMHLTFASVPWQRLAIESSSIKINKTGKIWATYQKKWSIILALKYIGLCHGYMYILYVICITDQYITVMKESMVNVWHGVHTCK